MLQRRRCRRRAAHETDRGPFANASRDLGNALEPDAAARGVTPLAWFDTATPLRSGWAWGQNYLQGGTAMVQADVGAGKLYLFGPEILFRGQPAGTFKLLFSGIFSRLVERSNSSVQ
jgi:hypothetical protein